jgi:hypothetical protein
MSMTPIEMSHERFSQLIEKIDALHEDLHKRNISHRNVDVVVLTKAVEMTNDERLFMAFTLGMSCMKCKALGLPF